MLMTHSGHCREASRLAPSVCQRSKPSPSPLQSCLKCRLIALGYGRDATGLEPISVLRDAVFAEQALQNPPVGVNSVNGPSRLSDSVT